ncbi:MAG: hypothetical protein AMXMBFR57_19350 [Acidimicrobiia bacterium]
MARHPEWAGVVRRLAASLVWLYPPSFRREFQPAFREAAEHRYRKVYARCGSPRKAAGITSWMLIVDAVDALPPLWLAAGVMAGGGSMRWFSPGNGALRQAWRMARRQPGFALLVILTMAVGIGTAAAAFNILDRAVLRPLAFRDADRLAYVTIVDDGERFRGTPPAEAVQRWRTLQHVVDGVEGYQPATTVYTANGVPELLEAGRMTAGLSTLLRVSPIIGRTLGTTDLEPGATPAVMVSDQFWRTRLGAAPDVVGQPITFSGVTYAIVGIWPAESQVDASDRAEVFFVAKDDIMRPSTWTYVVARLTDGTSLEQAERELTAASAGLESIRDGYRPSVTPQTVFLSREYVRGLWLAFGASLLLLLVAIGNATSLLLSRAVDRQREIGLRLALGGSTLRLARQFFVESAALTVPGALLAIVVAAGASNLLADLAEGTIPSRHFSGMNMSAVWFAAIGAFVSTVVCTLVPVLMAGRSDIGKVSGADVGGRVVGQTAFFRGAAVVGQAAVGVLLLAGAVIMARSVDKLTRIDVGFAARELVTFTLAPPTGRYGTPEGVAAFLREVKAQVAGMPGVQGVDTAGNPLFRFSTNTASVFLDGEQPRQSAVGSTTSTGAHTNTLDVLGLRLRDGRWFRADDSSGVVVVNESFARAHGGSIIGRRLFMTHPRATTEANSRSLEVIGVVADIAAGRPSRAGSEDIQIWMPSHESFDGFARFLVRTSADPDTTLNEIRRRVAALDPALPLLSPSTGARLLRADMAEYRLVAVVLGTLAGVGLVLAVAGIHGTVALDVRRRLREVGVRVALGATTGRVVQEVLARALRPVALGIGLGIVTWYWASGMLSSLLFRVDAHDPLSAVTGVAMLVMVAVIASLIPARRAGRVDPAITLRSE